MHGYMRTHREKEGQRCVDMGKDSVWGGWLIKSCWLYWALAKWVSSLWEKVKWGWLWISLSLSCSEAFASVQFLNCSELRDQSHKWVDLCVIFAIHLINKCGTSKRREFAWLVYFLIQSKITPSSSLFQCSIFDLISVIVLSSLVTILFAMVVCPSDLIYYCDPGMCLLVAALTGFQTIVVGLLPGLQGSGLNR